MGRMILSVRPCGVQKGEAIAEVLKRLCAEGESLPRIFSNGDDCTDTDMFHELYLFSREANIVVSTCEVGRMTTRAK